MLRKGICQCEAALDCVYVKDAVESIHDNQRLGCRSRNSLILNKLLGGEFVRQDLLLDSRLNISISEYLLKRMNASVESVKWNFACESQEDLLVLWRLCGNNPLRLWVRQFEWHGHVIEYVFFQWSVQKWR